MDIVSHFGYHIREEHGQEFDNNFLESNDDSRVRMKTGVESTRV